VPSLYKGIGSNGQLADINEVSANATLNMFTIGNVTSDYTIWHTHL